MDRVQLRLELFWLFLTLDQNIEIKDVQGAALMYKVVDTLFSLPSNRNRYETVEALLKDCMLSQDSVVTLEAAFVYTRQWNPRAKLGKVFRYIAHRSSRSSLADALELVERAHRLLVERRKQNSSVQPLLLRVLFILYEHLDKWERERFKQVASSIVQQAIVTRRQHRKAVQVLVLGDGYDRTLLTVNNDVLVTPSQEALAPYALAHKNHDLFLLTTNVTALHEYLPCFDACSRGNFAELYGSLFTSISPQHHTMDHEHVLFARSRLKSFLRHHQSYSKEKIQVRVIFAGIGFVRNGEGLRIVLSPHSSRYSSVSFYNREIMNEAQLRKCRYFLGLQAADEVELKKQFGGQDFRTYIARSLRWPLPELPSEEECKRCRESRIRRCIRVADVQETPGSTILTALSLVELEKEKLGMSLKSRKRKLRRFT